MRRTRPNWKWRYRIRKLGKRYALYVTFTHPKLGASLTITLRLDTFATRVEAERRTLPF